MHTIREVKLPYFVCVSHLLFKVVVVAVCCVVCDVRGAVISGRIVWPGTP